MALAALDNVSRRGRRGTGGYALLVVPQAALLLHRGTVHRPHRREALLAHAATVSAAPAALAHAGLLSESRSASRQLFCVLEETDRQPRSIRSNMVFLQIQMKWHSVKLENNTKISIPQHGLLGLEMVRWSH